MEAALDDTPARPRQTFALPSGAAYDRLTPLQRRAMVGAIVAAHGAAIWALLQVREVRDAVADVAPIFVSLVAPAPAPAPKIAPPPPPPPTPPVRQPIAPKPRIVTAAPAAAPAPFVVPPPPEPVPPAPVPAPLAIAAPVAPPAPPPPAPAPPRNLSASSVQYLEPLQVEYPRLSKRLGETGVVMLRIFIDEAGRVRDAQVSRTSGHPRLDDAAMAAVQKARFRPPSENGQAVSGYAQVPVDFQLER